MNSYYQIPTDRRDEFMNLQIDSWRAQIDLLNAVKPIIKAYNGKTYSKRLDNAIAEKLYHKDDRDNYVYISHSYGDHLYICVRCQRALVIKKEHYTDYHQINDRESCTGLSTYTPEDSKLRRIDAEQTIKNIDSKIDELHQDITKTLKAWANIDAYNAKIEQARQILREAADLIGGAPSEFTGLYKTEYTLKDSRY